MGFSSSEFRGLRKLHFCPQRNEKSAELRDSRQNLMGGTGPQPPATVKIAGSFSFFPRPVRVQRALSGLAKSDACSRGPAPLEVYLVFVTESFWNPALFLWQRRLLTWLSAILKHIRQPNHHHKKERLQKLTLSADPSPQQNLPFFAKSHLPKRNYGIRWR